MVRLPGSSRLWLIGFSGLGLAVVSLTVTLLVRWDMAQHWYPSAARQPGARVEWGDPGHRFLTWQTVFETEAQPGPVAQWYQQRLRLAHASGPYVAGGCAFMGQARDLLWLSRAVTVLVCGTATAQGTRVVITHRLTLWP